MPKSKEPPINWLMAVMLERKAAKGWTFADLAAKTGYAAGYLSQLFARNPWKWKEEVRGKVCTALGIAHSVQAECFEKQ